MCYVLETQAGMQVITIIPKANKLAQSLKQKLSNRGTIIVLL